MVERAVPAWEGGVGAVRAPTAEEVHVSSEAAVPEGSEGGPTAAEGAADDAKAKFLAALARKQSTRADSAGGARGEGSKVHGTHAAAGAKRNFRRKSGG
jgi:hypothetical protein